MDEPTAALSGVEVERLFAVARSLRDEGRGLIFISHRFDEVFSLCDMVTVMRGRTSTSREAGRRHQRGRDGLAHGGPRVADLFPKTPATCPATPRCLEVRELTAPASSTTSASMCVRARSSASRVSSEPAAARSPARSSGSDRYDSGRSPGWTELPWSSGPRTRVDLGMALHPRGSTQAGPGPEASRRPQRRRRHPGAWRRPGSLDRRGGESAGATVGRGSWR